MLNVNDVLVLFQNRCALNVSANHTTCQKVGARQMVNCAQCFSLFKILSPHVVKDLPIFAKGSIRERDVCGSSVLNACV